MNRVFALWLCALSTSMSLAADPIKISAADLYKQYDENELAADKKFKGKWIHVTGQVEKVRKDKFTGRPILELTVGRFSTLDCEMVEALTEALADLKKGDGVGLVGYCDGKGLALRLQNCLSPAQWEAKFQETKTEHTHTLMATKNDPIPVGVSEDAIAAFLESSKGDKEAAGKLFFDRKVVWIYDSVFVRLDEAGKRFNKFTFTEGMYKGKVFFTEAKHLPARK